MTLKKNLQLFLIAQGLVRAPGTVNPALPPMWLDPISGVPAPGQVPRGASDVDVGDPTVLAAYTAPGIPTGRHSGGLRVPSVDLRYRTRRAEQAINLDNAIYALLNDERNYMLNALHVQESLCSRELQLLGTDEFGYEHVSQYTFWVHADDYAQV